MQDELGLEVEGLDPAIVRALATHRWRLVGSEVRLGERCWIFEVPARGLDRGRGRIAKTAAGVAETLAELERWRGRWTTDTRTTARPTCWRSLRS